MSQIAIIIINCLKKSVYDEFNVFLIIFILQHSFLLVGYLQKYVIII